MLWHEDISPIQIHLGLDQHLYTLYILYIQYPQPNLWGLIFFLEWSFQPQKFVLTSS